MSALNIKERPYFDDRIVRKEFHSHFPYYSTSYNYNDEIRIPISQQDVFTLPSESYVYFECEGTDIPAGAAINVDSFGILSLFSEIRYELGGIEIDRSRNPGITSTMKSYSSFDSNETNLYAYGGWDPFKNNPNADIGHGSELNVCIPLKLILGFAEDYKKILVNIKQELIFRRANNDKNAFVITSEHNGDPKLKIKKIIWKIPFIQVADTQKYQLLKQVQNDTAIEIAFRSWDLYEYPVLPTNTNKEIWQVKTSTQTE